LKLRRKVISDNITKKLIGTDREISHASYNLIFVVLNILFLPFLKLSIGIETHRVIQLIFFEVGRMSGRRFDSYNDSNFSFDKSAALFTHILTTDPRLYTVVLEEFTSAEHSTLENYINIPARKQKTYRLTQFGNQLSTAWNLGEKGRNALHRKLASFIETMSENDNELVPVDERDEHDANRESNNIL
jgi:hypothetical protein